jgi:subtilisin family serine protease
LEETLNRELYFLDNMNDEVTITIPGTATHVITVGAIEVSAASPLMKAYSHSSQGPDRKGQEKPEIVAPGVGVRAALVGSRLGVDPMSIAKSGTSVAAPHVTGAIALALSARARSGKPQFNSYEIRVELRKSLRHLSVWNESTGYGELDAMAFLNRLARL